MRKLNDLLARVVVAGVIAVAAAVFLVGRSAVERHYDYREMTAPKSLHQLALETRGEQSRGGLLVAGAGLFAMSLVALGVFAFAMSGGQAFGRRAGRRRRRPAAPRVIGDRQIMAPPLPSLPRAPTLPALPAMTFDEGQYEEQG